MCFCVGVQNGKKCASFENLIVETCQPNLDLLGFVVEHFH